MPLGVPRDRNGTVEPQIIEKGKTRFDGFDEKILSQYSRGMTTREIQGHLKEIYGVEVSPAGSTTLGLTGQSVRIALSGNGWGDFAFPLSIHDHKYFKSCRNFG